MNSHYLVTLCVLLLPLLAAALGKNGDHSPLGAYIPLKNLDDPSVVKIANYAVDTYTHQKHKHLIFQKVIEGSYKIESGKLYKLVIRVKNDDVHIPTSDYEALVLSKGKVSKKLISFMEITN